MSKRGRRLVLVCEDEVQARVATEFAGGAIVAASPATLSDRTDLATLPPVLWVRPEDLARPKDRDSIDYRKWLYFWTLTSGCLVVRLVRLALNRGGESLPCLETEWAESLAEIQTQVRDFSHCSVVVFERRPKREELKKLDEWSLKLSPIYLMLPRLRVSREEQKQVFSVYVWPAAVSTLLLRLAEFGLAKDRGLFAWRSFSLRRQTGGGERPRDEGDVTAFFDWIRAVPPDPREGTPITPQLEGNQVPAGAGASPAEPASQAEGIAGRLGDRIASLKRVFRSRDLALDEGQKGEGIHLTSREVGDSASPLSYGSEMEKLCNFPLLLEQPDRDPGKLVEGITDPARILVWASKRGLAMRGEVASLYAEPIAQARRGDLWTSVTKDGPSDGGGPGRILAIQIGAETQVKQADEEAALRRMMELWSRELSRGVRDFEVERKFLGLCAEQLIAARRAMIALWPRVLLGLFSTVMLMAMVQQGVRLWLTPFRSGGSGADFRLMVMLAAASAAGAMVGICVPYLTELSRGRRAGAALARDAAALAESKRAAIDRRIGLCGAALKVMGPNLAAVAETRLVSRIASRAWKVCRDVFDRQKRGEDSTLAAEPDMADASLDESARFSVAAYNELCRFVVDPKAKDTTSTDSTGRRESALSAWKEKMPQHDYTKSGWLPAAEVDSLLGDAIAQVRGAGSASLDPSALKGDDRLRGALTRWSVPSGAEGNNLGMMSLHFIPGGKNPDVMTWVGGEPSAAEVIQEILKAKKMNQLDSKSGNNHTAISCQIAFVVQEISVEFDPEASTMAESDGGFVSVVSPRPKSRRVASAENSNSGSVPTVVSPSEGGGAE